MSTRESDHVSAAGAPERPIPAGAFETGGNAVGRVLPVDDANGTSPSTNGNDQVSSPIAAPSSHSKMDERYQLRGPRRFGMLVFGITSAILIASLAIAVLYSKWYRSEDYSSMIVVFGEESWEGATVTVKGAGLPAGGLSAPLEMSNNMMIRFHVPPGSYGINIIRGGKRLTDERHVTNLKANTMNWPFRPPVTSKATRQSE